MLISTIVTLLAGFKKSATQKILVMQPGLEQMDRQSGQPNSFRVASRQVKHIERAKKGALDKRNVGRRKRRFRDGMGAVVYRFHPSDRRSLLY